MASNSGNAAKRLPESETTDEPSMEEILSSIKQIIADDEQSVGGIEDRQNYSYPENPSNSNSSEKNADEVELSEALQAELDAMPENAINNVAEATDSVRTEQPKEDLETRVAAVRAELSSTSEALSPEERLQHYRSRNKLKSDTSGAEARAVQPADNSLKNTAPAIPSQPVRQPLSQVQQPAPAQSMVSPAPEAVAREMATIMLKEKSGELETMLADLMRPTIRQWLNDNLPSMVQRLVREEIRAASRGQKTS